jgi:type II secretory pathway pseudopilin PulG
VIIIVGILIAALLPRLTGSQARARDTARAAHINQIAQAAALFSADNPTNTLSGCSTTSTNLDAYLVSRPEDPSGTVIDSSTCGA